MVLMITCEQYGFADLEGQTDSKIRTLEVVEELRAKRADKQVIFCSFATRGIFQ